MSYHNLDNKNTNHSNNTSNVKSLSQTISNKSYQTILATDIPLTYSESDLYSIFSHYGSVNKIQKLSNLSCCLIEFSDSNASTALIKLSKNNTFYIHSHKIKLEFSSQTINVTDNKTTDNSTNILCINISNVKYPITVDIIKQICQKFGKLLRIFIGKKNPDNIVECLIEFEKISEAKSAKESLHGEDIYSGCCSLDVKYSKMPSVPVFKNDEESWDFTKSQAKQGILLPPPTNGSTSTLQNPTNNVNIYQPTPQVYTMYNYPPPLYAPLSNPLPANPIHPFPCRQTYDPNLMYPYPNFQKSSKTKPKLEINKDAFVVEIGVVFMVYNLPFNMGVDHLFNLFCLYGNVNRIRFLTNQSGSVMVQMGSRSSADACIQNFNNKVIFGQEIRLARCSKPEIFTTKKMEFLPNGTPVFKDFSLDPNNRFLNDHGINSNKILEPNRTLHFFNAPYSFAEADLSSMIMQFGVPRPLNIIIFSNKSDQIKKCIGLFEFHRLEDALVALSVLNHKPIIIPDTNQVFHLKLTFSAREPKSSSSHQNHGERKRYNSDRGDPDESTNQGNKKRRKSDAKDDVETSGLVVPAEGVADESNEWRDVKSPIMTNCMEEVKTEELSSKSEEMDEKIKLAYQSQVINDLTNRNNDNIELANENEIGKVLANRNENSIKPANENELLNGNETKNKLINRIEDINDIKSPPFIDIVREHSGTKLDQVNNCDQTHELANQNEVSHYTNCTGIKNDEECPMQADTSPVDSHSETVPETG